MFVCKIYSEKDMNEDDTEDVLIMTYEFQSSIGLANTVVIARVA